MDAPTDTTPPLGAAPTPPPHPGWPGPRQLRRRPDDGPIAGVCAGVAEYFNVDPVLVRIVAVVLAVSGPGLIAYILAWIFVPAASGPGPDNPAGPDNRGGQIFGLVLLALAASVLVGDWWSPGRRLAFPLGLMALGAWLLLRPRPADGSGPPVLPPPSPWPGGRSEPLRADPLTALPLDPADGVAAVDAAGWGGSTPPWGPATPAPDLSTGPGRRRLVGSIVLGALLAWAGVGWLLGVAVSTGLAIALVIVGGGIVMGGSRLLVVPALLLGTALGLAAVVDIPLSGPIGQQAWAPQSAAEVEPTYELSIGEGTLDLTGIDLPEGDQLALDASVGIGHLVVVVPTNLAVEVDTRVGLGDSRVLGIRREGVGLSTDQYDSDGATGGTVVLHLRAGVGQIEVRRAGATIDTETPPTTVIR